MVVYPATGSVSLTLEGQKSAPSPDTAKTLVERVRAVLTSPQTMLFDEMMRIKEPIHRAELASNVGWEPGGSNLLNRLSELSTLDLVTYLATGVVVLQDWVGMTFTQGLHAKSHTHAIF